MSIPSSAVRIALTAAAVLAAATSAEARPRRVVILDFDGPRRLADAGRSSVLSVLGDSYDVVATRRWEAARAAAAKHTHGPAQWSRAAKQSGVDAVIEGWVQDEGRRKILNVVVREAKNGKEFDTISVRLDAKSGMSSESTQKLGASLDEVLDWIDAGDSDPPPSTLPVVRVRRASASRPAADDEAGGAGPQGRPARVTRVADDDAGDASPQVRMRHAVIEEEDELTEEPVPAKRPKRPARDAADGSDEQAASEDAAPAEPAHEPAPTEVSTADREAHEIEILFPQASEERRQVLGAQAVHVPRATPRFALDAGPYYGSRSLLWDAPVDSTVQQFAGVSTKGLEVRAAAYPFPAKAMDGVLSGFGVTAGMHHSLGSSVISDEGDQTAEYVVNQNGWELGAHYRAPLGGLVTIDGGAFYGNQTFEIVDASPLFETPDTKYAYLGAGGHLDLAITERATVGFGARYFTVLDTGDLSSTEFFGPATASGLGLEGSFVIPLPASLYVRGQLAYQRIGLQLSPGGVIADEEGISSGKDAQVRGNVNVGIAF